MTRFILFLMMLTSTQAFAWSIVGKLPPPTHTLQAGTVQMYKSDGGAVRYFNVKETKESLCGTPELDQPASTTFKNPVPGLYKEYESPTGTISRWPVSFADECGAPISDDANPPPPPPQEVSFVGLMRVSINPIVGDSLNDCTFAEFEVTAKTFDDKYMFKFKRLFDGAVLQDGKRVCPYPSN